MRPHRLIIEGLRSYRSRTEIDFADASLFAIVGDTGSGKSSILEAMVYALYASATWTRQPGELISDGMRTMTVELTFEIDGRMWLVRRSMSRSAYPPSIHLLTAVDDSSIRFDTATSVDREIERLLGLSVDAFCSAVILPQGKFERLLTATPADRTRILKGIFRLERLDEARTLAKVLADRYEPAYQDLRRDRARLHDDPSSVAAEARERIASADDAIAKLTALQSGLTELEGRKRSLEQSKLVLETERLALKTASAAITPGEGDRLAVLAVELDTALTPLLANQATALTLETEAQAALDAARAGGVDAASLAGYRATITQAQVALPQVANRRAAASREQSEVAKMDEAWVADDASVVSLAAQSATAIAASTATQRDAEAAHRTHDAATTALERERTLGGQVAASNASLADIRLAVAAATEAQRRAEVAQRKAVARLEEAEGDLAAARSTDAAAIAAHGHRPGDACPVCAQVLPSDWRAPLAPGLEQASAKRDSCAAAEKVANRTVRDAVQAVALAEQQVDTAHQRADEFGAQHTAAVAELLAYLPGWTPEADGQEALATLSEALATALTTAQVAARTADEARATVTAAEARLNERRTSIDQRRAAQQAALTSIEAEEKRIAAALATLPGDLAITPRGTAEEIEAALGRLDELDGAEAGRQKGLLNARTAQREAGHQVRAIEDRRKVEYDVPMATYQGSLARLSAVVERAAGTLAADDLVGPAANDDVDARARQLLRRIVAQSADVDADVATTQVALNELLAAAGLGDAKEVGESLSARTGERAVADAEYQRAQSQIPLAADLDDGLARGGALLETLNELARLLGDGQFVGYVVGARQRALLGIASTILDDMSGGRYGFSEDFQIVDRTSGQPRSPRTLSGGETFQASLALALGLVELAGRSGGRLSSLFLDEGFGTLDANALDEALEELERRASAGRVIGVISHLRSVADRIEHILRVDKVHGRTEVRWVGGADLERLTSEDLAHTSGLLG